MPSPRPYLAFELDALKEAAGVATALQVHPGQIAWGLLMLWEQCWKRKTDAATELDLAFCFGPDQRIAAALERAGFLAKDGDGWRVRGAARYLRVSEARSKAGKDRVASAQRDSSGRLLKASADQLPSSTPPAPSQHTTSTPPALSSSIEHRTPILSSSEEDVSGEFELKPTRADPKPRRRSEAQEFWDHFQGQRTELHGLVREREPPPAKLNTRLGDAMSQAGTWERLWESGAHYLANPKDRHWADRGFPFNGWLYCWRDYLPAEARTA